MNVYIGAADSRRYQFSVFYAYNFFIFCAYGDFLCRIYVFFAVFNLLSKIQNIIAVTEMYIVRYAAYRRISHRLGKIHCFSCSGCYIIYCKCIYPKFKRVGFIYNGIGVIAVFSVYLHIFFSRRAYCKLWNIYFLVKLKNESVCGIYVVSLRNAAAAKQFTAFKLKLKIRKYFDVIKSDIFSAGRLIDCYFQKTCVGRQTGGGIYILIPT